MTHIYTILLTYTEKDKEYFLIEIYILRDEFTVVLYFIGFRSEILFPRIFWNHLFQSDLFSHAIFLNVILCRWIKR